MLKNFNYNFFDRFLEVALFNLVARGADLEITNELLDNQKALVIEEAKELLEAFESGDNLGILDAVCDIFFTAVYYEYLALVKRGDFEIYSKESYRAMESILSHAAKARNIRYYTRLEYLSDTVEAIVDDLVYEIDFGDVLSVVFHLIKMTEADVNEALHKVYVSNMSKMPDFETLFTNFEHLDLTFEEIIKQEVADLVKHNNCEVVVSSCPTYGNYVFKNKNTGKVLKPSTYFEPNLKRLIPYG